jgi:hypothetical protein
MHEGAAQIIRMLASVYEAVPCHGVDSPTSSIDLRRVSACSVGKAYIMLQLLTGQP